MEFLAQGQYFLGQHRLVLLKKSTFCLIFSLKSTFHMRHTPWFSDDFCQIPVVTHQYISFSYNIFAYKYADKNDSCITICRCV